LIYVRRRSPKKSAKVISTPLNLNVKVGCNKFAVTTLLPPPSSSLSALHTLVLQWKTNKASC
jgi:hypothetical protein